LERYSSNSYSSTGIFFILKLNNLTKCSLYVCLRLAICYTSPPNFQLNYFRILKKAKLSDYCGRKVSKCLYYLYMCIY
jgi:hypothetical protein